MTTETPDLSISRVFDAPRALVYRAFTDPEQVAAWWGPTGFLDLLIEWETSPELAAQSDLTAESACTWAAASWGTSR